ncbi:hypothetical protein UlMin_004864 [Ulmus minor]
MCTCFDTCFAHNKTSEIDHKNFAFSHNNNKGFSPYYRGLLANYSDPLSSSPGFVRAAQSLSPGRQSHATTAAFSRVSLTATIIGASCFLFEGKKEGDDEVTPTTSGLMKPKPTSAAAAADRVFNSIETRKMKKNSDISGLGSSSNNQQKPLRESLFPKAATTDEEVVVERKNEEIVDDESWREFAWADKYQPKALEDFICNRGKAIELQTLARGGDCGHFIFEGPPGVGKRTMICAMLREAFGPEAIMATEESKTFNIKGEAVGSIEVLVKESPRLIEVNVSELKGYEKHVIFELIKETSRLMSNKSMPCKPPDNCRAIIFYGVDKLSSDAVLYIKWLLERYKVCNKIFFCCSDVSKLQAIKSLCTLVKLLPPSEDEIVQVLQFIASGEGIELPHPLAEKIAHDSKNNLRQAIRSFEATWSNKYPFAEDDKVLCGWEDEIAHIAKNMMQEQSPKQLYVIRGKLQNLIEHDVCPDFIFKSLVEELKGYLEEHLKRRVHNLYLGYNRKDENVLESEKMRRNVHRYLRIEEFIAKFMSCYKAEAAKSVKQETEEDDNNAP